MLAVVLMFVLMHATNCTRIFSCTCACCCTYVCTYACYKLYSCLFLHLCSAGARDGVYCAAAGDPVCNLGRVSAHKVCSRRRRPHGGGGEKLPGQILLFCLWIPTDSVLDVIKCLQYAYSVSTVCRLYVYSSVYSMSTECLQYVYSKVVFHSVRQCKNRLGSHIYTETALNLRQCDADVERWRISIVVIRTTHRRSSLEN